MNRKIIKNSNLVLREILNNSKNVDILKNFVESILKIEIKELKINRMALNNGENIKEYGIADMRIKLSNNEELNVGIQVVDGDYIQNKMFLYYAKIHSNQILHKDNRKIVQTITINILDMEFFSSAEYNKKIKIKSNVINDEIIETIELNILELPKFNIGKKTEISDEEAWVMYLKGANEKEIEFAKENNPSIKKLDELLQKYWEDEII